jgi:vitamin B12 transporter
MLNRSPLPGIVGLAAMLALSAPSSAQVPGTGQVPADTFRLGEIVVTAARLPMRLADAPGSITVLTRDDLRERGIRYAADALRLVPGTAVVQGAGAGALTSVFMRGGESDYVQVLVDGIQVNDAGGAFDWAHLRTDDIERIEVLRGPASVLYGSDAVSGVVQIFTRAGGAPRIDVSATTGLGGRRGPDPSGTHRTHGMDASLTGSTAVAAVGGARLGYGVHATQHASNGLYTLNSSYDNTNLSGRLHFVAPRADAAVTARNTTNTFHYPTDGSGAVVDANQFSTGDVRSVGVDAGYRVLPALELRVLATTHTSDGRTEDPADNADDGTFWGTNSQSRRKLDARVNAHLPRGAVLTAGAEREWQAAVTAYESVSSYGTWEDATDENRRNTGWFAQLHALPVAGVAVTVGGRVDENEQFGTFRTGRAALSWTPARGTRLHGAFGTAFKEPTFFENYATGFVRGNPDLQPEQARSWEGGAEHALAAGRVTLAATWFDQRFRNLIQYTASPPTAAAPNYFNIGAARARGAETSARADLGRIRATASYTRTDTRVGDEGFGSDAAFQQGMRLLRRPQHQAYANVSFALSDHVNALVDLRHTGRRDDLDFTGPAAWTGGDRIALPAYTTLDVGAGYAALRRGESTVDITLRVRNALDTQYTEIHNFPAAGRVLQLGVRAGLGL